MFMPLRIVSALWMTGFVIILIGVFMVFIGGICNILAFVSNRWKMPVRLHRRVYGGMIFNLNTKRDDGTVELAVWDYERLVSFLEQDTSIGGFTFPLDTRHCILTRGTRCKALCDIIPYAYGNEVGMMSIGDCLMIFDTPIFVFGTALMVIAGFV